MYDIKHCTTCGRAAVTIRVINPSNPITIFFTCLNIAIVLLCYLIRRKFFGNIKGVVHWYCLYTPVAYEVVKVDDA